MGKPERTAWISLVVTSVVAWLYFSHVLALPPDASLRFSAGYVTGLIVLTVMLTVFSEVGMRVGHRTVGLTVDDSSLEDERDALIGLKAGRISHAALSAGVFAVLAQVALLEWLRLRPGHPPRSPDTLAEAILTGPVTPMIIWHLLLAVLQLAAMAGYLGRIVLYRRGG